MLDNYDNVELSGKGGGFINSDKTPAQTIIYTKRVNGNYYVVEAVPDTKKHNLEIITVYKTKGDESGQRLAHSPQGTPQHTPETFPTAENNIQQPPV